VDTASELLPMESEYVRTVAKGSLKATFRFLGPCRAKQTTRRQHSRHALTTAERNSIHEVIKLG